MNLTLTDTVAYKNEMTITGIPNSNGDRFIINIGNREEDINLNFNVHFDLKKIIMKTIRNGREDNEVVLDRFPFVKGQNFQINIKFSKANFTIKMPNDYIEVYSNYFGADSFKFIQVLQDVRIKSFNIE